MALSNIISILKKLTQKVRLSSAENKLLQEYSWYEADPFEYQKKDDLYEQKKAVVEQIYPAINSLCDRLKFNNRDLVLQTLWFFWLPLALELFHKRQQQTLPLVFGILGGQGTGKTTLTRILPLIWDCWNIESVAISIDDLYKTYAQRQKLLETDPRLVWRGPPATHDLDLGIKIIDRLREGQTNVEIPRFDKSLYDGIGDRTLPERVNKVDIIILEGWFVGITPVEDKVFDNAPFPIVTEDDRQFARDNNIRLQEYLPLWAKIDYLMIFNPQEYQYSLKWRKQAEHLTICEGKKGMSDEQIEEFVYYFWRALHPEIYLKPLLNDPQKTDLVVDIDVEHCVDRLYRPRYN